VESLKVVEDLSIDNKPRVARARKLIKKIFKPEII
jgi:hypothetical protein